MPNPVYCAATDMPILCAANNMPSLSCPSSLWELDIAINLSIAKGSLSMSHKVRYGGNKGWHYPGDEPEQYNNVSTNGTCDWVPPIDVVVNKFWQARLPTYLSNQFCYSSISASISRGGHAAHVDGQAWIDFYNVEGFKAGSISCAWSSSTEEQAGGHTEINTNDIGTIKLSTYIRQGATYSYESWPEKCLGAYIIDASASVTVTQIR